MLTPQLMGTNTGPSIEYAVDLILRELNITRPEDLQYLEEIAWRRGAMVRYHPLEGSEARLTVYGQRAIITISDVVVDPHRIRFSIAHELGHLELRHHDGAFSLCTASDLDILQDQKSIRSVEGEANTFASTFLMPRKFFQSLCDDEDPSLDFIARLAHRFRVSLTTAALRYIQLCKDACAIVYSVDGRVEWFSGSQEFRENRVFIETKVRLDAMTQAAKSFRGIHATEPRSVPATAWFAPGKYSEDAQVTEQSWHMRNYNSVLTLLWINDDIFDQDEWLF